MKNLLSRLAAAAALITLAACGDSSSLSPRVAVSGSISGLNASGLVLTDGFSTVTLAAGATSFSFSMNLTTGDTYLVAVKTQPAGELCTVANASGDITNAGATNVVVTCRNDTFQLGGTVSGLNGTGLVLATGSNTVAVASGAQSFAFATSLSQGTSYAVTVKTQPTNQICSVANGNGTIATANVANVVVTCATQAFRLGGSITGLTTSGLVLANGSDVLAVAANASTFTLPTPVAAGSSYHVTVQTQPAGLACAVTGGSNTMPGAAVTTVAVNCTSRPFTLGGTISGLVSAGLVLTNGNDTLSVAANASTFTMPTPVMFGATYALNIHSQPTGLSCSFSNGGNVAPSSGTMPAANVTTVALVCAPQSYALGGTVSGLSSGTVVLANGTDTLSVTTNGAFQMPTPVAYGSTYTVVVQTQPTGLTCSVGNATNTMPAGAVTNVTVTCAVNTYSISGTVAGLTTTGLVLQDNGTDNTAVAANATQFSMPTALAFGSSYNITVLTQPAGQTCSVTNGSGPVTGPVTNVQIDCPHTVTFTNVGMSTWTVPAGITSVTVTAYGGGGGGGTGTQAPGGNGALVTSSFTVQPADSVTIYVGAGGVGGFDEGGGGGGLTYVADGATEFLIAGGGGGGSGGPYGFGAPGGNAGSAGGNAATQFGNPGGTGGAAGSNGAGGAAGTGGQNQTAGSAFTNTTTAGSGSGGTGGGGSVVNAGGSGISSTIGNGGSGSYLYGAGGGGGGFGGGGGGGGGQNHAVDGGGGGGGGSTGPAGTTTVGVAPAGGPGAGGAAGTGYNGATSGSNGSVTISYL